MSHPSFVCSYFPESNCKLSKVRQAISDAAECTACIPCSAVMSSIHKVWKLVIQGQQNKAANRESKYITAHFSPPELNWQCWISKFGPGPNGNNSTHSSLEWRERRTAASWEPGRHLADLCCLLYDPSGNWVGAGSLSSGWLCVCVCLRLWQNFSGQDILGKNIYKENHLSSQLTALPCQCSLPPDGVAAGIGHAFISLF